MFYYRDGDNVTKFTSKYFRYLLTNNITNYEETENPFDTSTKAEYTKDSFVSAVVENIPSDYVDNYLSLLSLQKDYALAFGYLIIEHKIKNEDIELFLKCNTPLKRNDILLDLLDNERFSLLDTFNDKLKSRSYTPKTYSNLFYFSNKKKIFQVTKAKLSSVDSDLMNGISYTAVSGATKIYVPKTIASIINAIANLANNGHSKKSLENNSNSKKYYSINSKDITKAYYNKFAAPIGYIDSISEKISDSSYSKIVPDLLRVVLKDTYDNLDFVKNTYLDSTFTKSLDMTMANYKLPSDTILDKFYPNNEFKYNFNLDTTHESFPSIPSKDSFITNITTNITDEVMKSIATEILNACKNIDFSLSVMPEIISDLINFDIHLAHNDAENKFFITQLPKNYFSYSEKFDSKLNEIFSTVEAGDLGKKSIEDKMLATLDTDCSALHVYDKDKSLLYNLYKIVYVTIIKDNFRNFIRNKAFTEITIDEGLYKFLTMVLTVRNAILSTIMFDRKLHNAKETSTSSSTIRGRSNRLSTNLLEEVRTKRNGTYEKSAQYLYSDIVEMRDNVLSKAAEIEPLKVASVDKTILMNSSSIKDIAFTGPLRRTR